MDERLENKEWLQSQYQSGCILAEIGKMLGVHRNTVRNRLIKFGIKRRKVGARKGIPKPPTQRAKMSAARKVYWVAHPATDEFKLKISKSKTKTGITKAGRKVYIPGRGRVLEHRLVMENLLGRRLQPCEHVHHVDGNNLNNSPENLRLLISGDHACLHSKDRQRDKLGRYC